MRILFVLLLAGCATPEERADRLIARYGPFCDRLGYERNTDAWRNCVVQQAPKPPAVVGSPPRGITCTHLGAQTICN